MEDHDSRPTRKEHLESGCMQLASYLGGGGGGGGATDVDDAPAHAC